MKCIQRQMQLRPRNRGVHLITREVLDAFPELQQIQSGMLHVFIPHTSASLTLNENADPSVRMDLERHLDVLAPEEQAHYTHTYEGPDDMPAHIKASLMGSSVQIPIVRGNPGLGTWQGIYLCEHRDQGGARSLILTAWGV